MNTFKFLVIASSCFMGTMASASINATSILLLSNGSIPPQGYIYVPLQKLLPLTNYTVTCELNTSVASYINAGIGYSGPAYEHFQLLHNGKTISQSDYHLQAPLPEKGEYVLIVSNVYSDDDTINIGNADNENSIAVNNCIATL